MEDASASRRILEAIYAFVRFAKLFLRLNDESSYEDFEHFSSQIVKYVLLL